MSGFIENTIIKTNSGDKKISEIKKGDLLISGLNNNLVKVISVFKNKIHTRLVGFNNNNFAVFTHCFIKNNIKYSFHPDLSMKIKHWDRVVQGIKMTISEIDDYEIYNLVTEDHSFIANNYSVSDDFFDIDKYKNETIVIYNVIKEINQGSELRIDQLIDKHRNNLDYDLNNFIELLENNKLYETMGIIWRDYLKIIDLGNKVF